MRDRDKVESLDTGEVLRIAGVQRQPVCDCDSSNHCVVGPGCRLATRPAKRGGDSTEDAGGIGIERKGVENGLGLLKMRQARFTFRFSSGHQRANGQLGQCDGGDEWFSGKTVGCLDPSEEDERVGIEQTATTHARGSHSDESMTASRSWRSRFGSISGSRDHRSRTTGPASEGRGNGRSSATGLPSRVMMIRSPAATRSTTSPP
jgi:hypothetical protein